MAASCKNVKCSERGYYSFIVSSYFYFMGNVFRNNEDRESMKKRKLMMVCILIMTLLLTSCTPSQQKEKDKKDHLTVYLWDNNMIKNIVPYIKEQLPDQEIEFIVGNNNVDLYNYLEKHGDLPDIITTRRFSEKDAKTLQPYLLDLGAYDIVSEYYPYALQYYTDSEQSVKWLPVCGIPETIIANKSLFDKYGMKIPKNYKEFARCCKKFHENNIKPYEAELSMDWAAHSLFQGAAIDQFSSIDGISWRSKIESSSKDNVFKDDLWKQIFKEVNTFIKDTYLTKSDLKYDLTTVRQKFINGEVAMFRGTPSVMDYLKSNMDDELIRIPYFSQTSDESWIYTYPSFNVALNSNLEENEEKLDVAMQVLDCFISEKGQKLVADGDGMISYNAHVQSDLSGMKGVKNEIGKNAFYIRYASNGSFTASFDIVRGLVSGKMNETQAYEEFKKEINSKKGKESSVIKFKDQYDISLNDHSGRDAASAILTTVRKDQGVDLAFSPYYYYTTSIYAGSCTSSELNMMIAHNDGTSLSVVNISGEQMKKLIDQYLTGTKRASYIISKYELPIASGMKLIVKKEKDHFRLKDIWIDGKTIDSKKQYRILLTDELIQMLKQMDPDKKEIKKTDLATDWISVISKGKQPSKPEDYIEIQ